MLLNQPHFQQSQLTEPQPQPDPEPAVVAGLKTQLQLSHDQNVDMLRGMGVDPCVKFIRRLMCKG